MNYSRKLVRLIKNSKKTVIATHIDPDCDGISSALACRYIVKYYKHKNPILFCHSPIPQKYGFLLEKCRFTNKLPNFDLLIAVDSADIARILPDFKEEYSEKLKNKNIINIDHHKSNDKFGQLKIIDGDASSACEIIYRILNKLKIRIDKKLAEILYSGIYIETGAFAYPNTNKEVLQIAGRLVCCGVVPSETVKKLNAKTLCGTRLLSEVLRTVEVKNGIGVMWLTQAMLKKCHARMSDSENFVSFLQSINDVHISVFLREERDSTRVSLRSDGIVDVDKFARRFGGGGHRLAAGIKMVKEIKTARKEILKALNAISG